VHLFQNDAMLTRPGGRIAKALRLACWTELGIELKVNSAAAVAARSIPYAVHGAPSRDAANGCPAVLRWPHMQRESLHLPGRETFPVRMPCRHVAHAGQVADVRDTLSMVVLELASQHAADGNCRLRQLAAIVLHFWHVAAPGAPSAAQPPALAAKPEVR